jgi:hypothetical protein
MQILCAGMRNLNRKLSGRNRTRSEEIGGETSDEVLIIGVCLTIMCEEKGVVSHEHAVIEAWSRKTMKKI